MVQATPSADKIYSIANAEVGYQEGSNNYNKYAAYVGVPNNDAWCTTFNSWIFKTAGFQSLTLMSDYSVDQYNWFNARGRANPYPAVGATVWYGPGGGEHTGWVYAYDADYIYTIEGNWGNKVQKMKRPRREALDGLAIFMYGYPAFTEGIVTADPNHTVAGSVYAVTASVNSTPSTGGGTTTPPVDATLYNPYPNGVLPVPNGTSPSAKGLQTLLIHAKYLAANTVLADTYGPLTQAAVKAFYTAHPEKFFPDVTIGPLGYAQLIEDAKKADGVTTTPPVTPPTTPEEPTVPTVGGTVKFYQVGPGTTNDSNKVVQKALNYEFGGVVVDGIWGTQTSGAYKKWQQKLGFTGSDADGAPGKTSMDALAKKYKFSVDYTVPAGTNGEPAMDMTRTTYGGKTVNQRTKVMLQAAAKEFGGPLTLTQGSYNKGVTASAGTHDGGGVVDINVNSISSSGRTNLIQCLRRAGFAAWLRTPAQGFAYHIHCNAIGDREMSPEGKEQVVQYFRGQNGLANHGADTNPPRPWPAWANKYK